MRKVFIEPTVAQLGGALYPVYRGVPYQRGAGLGGILRSVLRFLVPIGKSVAREGLKAAVGVGGDVLQGRDIGESAQRRMAKGARRVVKRAVKKKGQKGGKLGRRTKRGGKKTINRRKKCKTTRIPKNPLGLYYQK